MTAERYKTFVATQRPAGGVCRLHDGHPGPATEHLRAYLDGVPGAEDADAVQNLLKDARKQLARWN